MKVLFRESFVRDLRRIEDQDIQRRIRQAVESVEQATSLRDVPHLRRLRSRGRHYRIRVGTTGSGSPSKKTKSIS